MNEKIMIQQQEFGQEFLNKMNSLNDLEIKELINNLTLDSLGNVGYDWVLKDCKVRREIESQLCKKISLLGPYESIEINWWSITHKAEHGTETSILKIHALFYLDKMFPTEPEE